MSTRCEDCRVRLADLLSQPSGGDGYAEVRRHLEECSDCRAYYESLQADDRLLRGFAEAMRPAVEAVEDAVLASLHESSRRSTLPHMSTRGHRLWYAAAAVVVLAILGAAGRLLGPFDPASPSLARTLQAIQAKRWVHTVTEVHSAEGVRAYEDWECFRVHITARRTSDGFVRYANFSEKVVYEYNPHSNKITVGFTTDNYMVPRQKTPFARLSESVASAGREDATTSRCPAPEYGRHAEFVRIDFTDNPVCESMVLIRDTEQNLLLRMEHAMLHDGERSRLTTTFDYPESGPVNIYALGVPAEAVVHDTRPGGPALDLANEVQTRFERGFGDHTAVILESQVGPDGGLAPLKVRVLSQTGDLKQARHYYAFDFAGVPRQHATLHPLIKDQWPDLTIPEILALEDGDALERRMVFDGRKTVRDRREQRELVRDEHATDQFNLLYAGTFSDSLTAMIWPNLHIEFASGSSQFQKTIRLLPDDPNRPGLVGLQIARFAETEDYWFDPQKDYMLMERIHWQEGIGMVTRDLVLASESTPSGRWCPGLIQTEFVRREPEGSVQIDRRQKRVLVDTVPAAEATALAAAEPPPAEQTTAGPTEVATIPRLEPPAQGVHGVVRDEQGTAIGGATVLLSHQWGQWGLDDEIVQSIVTDPRGRYRLTEPIKFARTEPHDYAQDRYALFAIHPDHALAWQNIRQGQEKSVYDLTLTSPTARTILVTDLAGTPIPGARVWLYSAGDRTSSNPLFQDHFLIEKDVGLVGAVTDASGVATITNLPATGCSFHATQRGFATGLAFFAQNHIRLTPGADLSGWVLTHTGAPVPGAIVRLQAEWMHNHFLARSDAGGRFAFVDLPAEGWDTSPWGLSKGGNGTYTMVLEHADYAAPNRELKLLPGQAISDLVIEVAAETTVVRCLVVEEGTDRPVPGACLSGENAIGAIHGYADANGVFTVRVISGPTDLSFHSPPNGVYIVDGSIPEGGRAQFEARGERIDLVLKAPRIAGRLIRVLGVVLGPERVPVVGAVVCAAAGRFETATAGSYVRPTGTDAEGRFELKEVPAGRDLHLFVETKDHVLAGTDVVPIPADANQLPVIELMLRPTRSCAVVILDKEGTPATETALTATPLVAGERMWMSSAPRAVRTDRLGILQMDGVVPGLMYRLRDRRFDETSGRTSGRRPEGHERWLDTEMVLVPLE